MSDQTRRETLRQIGMSLALSGMGVELLTAQQAGHVHEMVQQAKAAGPYKPKLFTAHEYATLRRLAELIMPADEHSKSALEAGAPEFIDLLCSSNADLAEIFTGGMAWIDNEMQHRYGGSFVTAKPEQQTALLDLLAYRKNHTGTLAPGVRFFVWARNLVVDAFYTSQIGMDDLGFMGNGAVSEFKVPQAAIDYAVKRSPV